MADHQLNLRTAIASLVADDPLPLNALLIDLGMMLSGAAPCGEGAVELVDDTYTEVRDMVRSHAFAAKVYRGSPGRWGTPVEDEWMRDLASLRKDVIDCSLHANQSEIWLFEPDFQFEGQRFNADH